MLTLVCVSRFVSWLRQGKFIPLAITPLVLFSANANADGLFIPPDAQTTCVESAGDFSTWFDSGTVTANGIVNPANSVTTPVSPNCDFYRWSEHMFLWLTSPAPLVYGSGGHVFNSSVFYDVSPLDSSNKRHFIAHSPGLLPHLGLRLPQLGPHGLPLIFNKSGRMFEVHTPKKGRQGGFLVPNRAGKLVEIHGLKVRRGKAVFLDRRGHPLPINLRLIKHPALRRAPIRLHQTKRLMTESIGAKGKITAREMTKAELKAQIPVVQRFQFNPQQLPIFVDSAGNVINVETGQAGGGGVLIARNGSLVYYTIEVNDVFAYFLTGNKDGGISPAPTHFPINDTQLNQITAFASLHGKTFPDPNALTVEVKTSWVEATGLDTSKYITMKATVPKFDKTDPDNWKPNGQKTVTLAMVGMHVVGSVRLHDEMVWATFEHKDNTPNATYQYDSTSGTKTVNQDTSGNWLFCANNSSGPFNVERQFDNAGDIKATDTARHIGPSDTIRWKAWGAAFDKKPNPLDPTTAASNTELISINNSVMGLLASGDVRKNYVLTGATWTFGGEPTPSNQVGTSMMANTTMETYMQGNSNQSSSGTNCFTCHAGNMLGDGESGLSHIYGVLNPLF